MKTYRSKVVRMASLDIKALNVLGDMHWKVVQYEYVPGSSHCVGLDGDLDPVMVRTDPYYEVLLVKEIER